MAVYIVLAILTCVLAGLVEQKNGIAVAENTSFLPINATRQQTKNKSLIVTIFLALFGVSACRIAIGHDYWEYTAIFELIEQNRYVSTEFGFNWLVRICHFIFGTGDYSYLPIFAVIAFFTMLFFVKALCDQSEDFGCSFFLFMVFGYYLSSFNSIRYYLVLAVAVYSVKFILKKKYAHFALCILLAAPFHMAVLFVLLAYPLALMKWNKWNIPIVSAVVISLLAFPGFYRKLIFFFYPFYENSIYDTGETSVTNIVRCAGVLIFALIYYKSALKDNRKNMFYFNLNLEAFIVYACCSFIPVVSRIGFFLNIFQIFLIPSVLRSIPKKWQRVVFSVLIALAGVGYFMLFLKSCKDDGTRIVPYLNWILN